MDHQESGDQPADDTNKNVPPPETIGAVPERHKTPQPSEKSNGSANPSESTRKITWLEYVLAGTNVVLVLVGIWALSVYRGQLNVMQHTLDEMKHSGQGNTDQTNALIGNMNWLAGTMDGSLQQISKISNATVEQGRLDQRAWIGAMSVYTSVPANAPKLTVGALAGRLGMEIKNTGKTPALHVTSKISATVIPWDQAFEPFYGQTIPFPRSVSAMSPGATHPIIIADATTIIDANTIQQLKDRLSRFYMYGIVNYTDIFKQRHYTEFCLFAVPPTFVEF
jgi:hypothetical protein